MEPLAALPWRVASRGGRRTGGAEEDGLLPPVHVAGASRDEEERPAAAWNPRPRSRARARARARESERSEERRVGKECQP